MSENRQSPRLPLPGPTLRRLEPHDRIHWHHHTRHQLIHPGTGILQVETPAGSWIVPPQRAVWIPALTPHAHLARARVHMRTLSMPVHEDPLGATHPVVVEVGPLLRELVVALTDPEPDPPRTAAERAALERAAHGELARARRLPLHLPAPVDDRLRAVAALLHADPADPRGLAQLGAAVGAGERTLSRLFRVETGMTFPQWRTQLRLHHALSLLAQGRSVTAVAMACGYATPSAFIEAFRAAFGTTPGRHRPGTQGQRADGGASAGARPPGPARPRV